MPDFSGHRTLVDPAMGDGGPDVRSRSAMITGELQTLKNKLVPIMDGTQEWQGDGQNHYAPYQAEWDTAAKGLFDDQVGVMGQIAWALDQCWINYCNNEHAITRGWTPGGH